MKTLRKAIVAQCCHGLIAAFFLFGSPIGISSSHAGTAEPQKNDQLKQLILIGLQNNAELKSLQHQAEAARARVPLAGALENPRLSLGLANVPTDSFDLDQEAMTQKQISLSQKIPWYGKRDLARSAAAITAKQQEERFLARKLRLIRQISETWYDLRLVEQSLGINAQLKQLISQMQGIAETRYATGQGLQQDILEAQLQQSILINDDIALQGKKEQLTSNLYDLLGTATEIKMAHPLFPSKLSTLPAREMILAQLIHRNPELASLRLSLKKAELGVVLAQKEYGSDMDFRLSYGQREDSPTSERADFFSASITFSLPLWQSDRQDNLLASRKKELLAARQQLEFAENSLTSRIDGLMAEISSADNSSLLFSRELGIQAKTLADASLSAYSVGKALFTTALNARVKTLRFQLDGLKAHTTALKKRAQLEEIIGGFEHQQSPLSLNGGNDSLTEKSK